MIFLFLLDLIGLMKGKESSFLYSKNNSFHNQILVEAEAGIPQLAIKMWDKYSFFFFFLFIFNTPVDYDQQDSDTTCWIL